MRSFLHLVFLLAPSLVVAAEPAVEAVHPRLRDCPLPEPVHTRWKDGGLTDAELGPVLESWRAERPEVFGATPPPAGSVRLVPDFAPMETLHLVVPSWSDHKATYVRLLDRAARQGRVRASLFSADDLPWLRERLKRVGTPVDRIVFDTAATVESIWMRDYGPMPVQTEKGVGVLEFGYAPDCTTDDEYPISTVAPGQTLYRSALYLDGGNLLTDGRGACFTTELALRDNGITADALTTELQRMAGCEEVVILEPLHGQLAEHADVFLTPAPDGVLLLASFESSEDSENHAIMQRNRATLVKRAAARGWTLVDLPTPPRGPGSRVRTWNNLLPFNGVVFVPDFPGAPTERLVQAWNRIQAAFPGRELVAVPSEPLLETGGAVHCVARALPAYVGG